MYSKNKFFLVVLFLLIHSILIQAQNTILNPLDVVGDSNIFRLIASRNGYTDETVIGFYQNASNGFDVYDSEKMFSSDPNYPQIYTEVEGHKLAINGMAPFTVDSMIIDLGFKAMVADTFSLTATNLYVFDQRLDVYLHDKNEDEIIHLREDSSYTFLVPSPVNTTQRFSLYFVMRDSYTTYITTSGNWSNLAGDTKFFSRVFVTNNAEVTLETTTTDTCGSLIIKPNCGISINGELTLWNDLRIISDSSGMGSLIDNGTLTVLDSTLTQLYLGTNSTLRNWRYVSIPVPACNSSIFQAAIDTNKLYYWDEPCHDWTEITDNTTPLNVMQGYAVGIPHDTTITFTGVVNTSIQSKGFTRTPGDYEGYNLAGNPFPSAIDIGSGAWGLGVTAVNLETTIWYRSDGNFAIYNILAKLGSNGGGRYIPAMQAFWVKVADGYTNGSITFKNEARVHDTTDFYDNKAHCQDVIRLEAKREGYKDEALIAFFSNASYGFDDYDSEKRFASNENYPQIYSIVKDKKLAINSLREPSNDTLRISLGFKTLKTGEITIEATNIQYFNPLLNVFLEDRYNGKIICLDENPQYQFFVKEPINTTNRFQLLICNNSSVGIEEPYSFNEMYFYNGMLHIPGELQKRKANLFIYNVYGQLVYKNEAGNSLPGKYKLNLVDGIYIAQFIKESRIIATKKILVK